MRTRFVRVQVRRRTSTKSAVTGVASDSFRFVRWQKFHLRPMSAQEAVRVARMEVNADWVAIGRRKPIVKDGDRLYAYEDGELAYILDVIKVLPVGSKVHVLVKERGGIQS